MHPSHRQFAAHRESKMLGSAIGALILVTGDKKSDG